MKPPMRIFDPAFRYVPSWATDIRKTFKRASRHATAREARPQTVVRPSTHGSSVHQLEIQAHSYSEEAAIKGSLRMSAFGT